MKVPEWTEVASILAEFRDTYDVFFVSLTPSSASFLCGSTLQIDLLEHGVQSSMDPHLTDFSFSGDIAPWSLTRLPDNIIFSRSSS